MGRAVQLQDSPEPAAVPAFLWRDALMLSSSWWLSGGGRWAAAQTVVVLGCQAALVLGERYDVMLYLPRMRQPVALADWLLHHLLASPTPLLIVRGVWGLLWHRDWWAALVGAGAALLLYWHLTLEPFQPAARRGGGAPLGCGSTRHLFHEVPHGAPAEVARILQAGNYYEVLALAQEASEAEVRRAKRVLALATHPDKIGAAPGANAAFNLVTEASDMLCDVASRQEYDETLQRASMSFNMSPEELEARTGIPAEFMDRMDEFLEAVQRRDIPQRCDVCGSIHWMRRCPDRPPRKARQCDECGTRHAVHTDEIWFEAESAGFLRGRIIRMYCCFEGQVYDMSETAACDGTLRLVSERRCPLNGHHNIFRGMTLSSGGRSGGGKKGRQGGRGQASTSAPRQQGPGGTAGKKKGRRR